jgi:hypothetical protein
MACEARLLQEDTVYTIGETDFVATRQCGVATTKSILNEGSRIPICEACMKNRKNGQGHGWFDDAMSPDATYVHSRRFYEALLDAYKGEGLGEKADPGTPGTLRRWFEKNLAEGEKEELQEELVELKEKFESMGGNKPDDMPFSEFLGLVKRRVEIEKRLRDLHMLTS